jgi:hypothetical protein
MWRVKKWRVKKSMVMLSLSMNVSLPLSLAIFRGAMLGVRFLSPAA